MKYIFVVNNVVHDVIPEYSEDFPGVDVKKRYPEEFLKQCFIVEDDFDIENSYEYLETAKAFKKPIRMLSKQKIYEMDLGSAKRIPLDFNIKGALQIQSDLDITTSEGKAPVVKANKAGSHIIHFIFQSEDGRTYEQGLRINVVEPESIQI